MSLVHLLYLSHFKTSWFTIYNHYLMSVSVSGITTADISVIGTSVNFLIGAPLILMIFVTATIIR